MNSPLYLENEFGQKALSARALGRLLLQLPESATIDIQHPYDTERSIRIDAVSFESSGVYLISERDAFDRVIAEKARAKAESTTTGTNIQKEE